MEILGTTTTAVEADILLETAEHVLLALDYYASSNLFPADFKVRNSFNRKLPRFRRTLQQIQDSGQSGTVSSEVPGLGTLTAERLQSGVYALRIVSSTGTDVTGGLAVQLNSNRALVGIEVRIEIEAKYGVFEVPMYEVMTRFRTAGLRPPDSKLATTIIYSQALDFVESNMESVDSFPVQIHAAEDVVIHFTIDLESVPLPKRRSHSGISWWHRDSVIMGPARQSDELIPLEEPRLLVTVTTPFTGNPQKRNLAYDKEVQELLHRHAQSIAAAFPARLT